MKGKFKCHLDDYGAQEANCYLIALHFYRIKASDMRWRMFRLKLAKAKERFIDSLDIDISDADKSIK